MKLSIKFKAQDLWIGAYWERRETECSWPGHGTERSLDVWICLVPMLPIRLHFGPGKGRRR